MKSTFLTNVLGECSSLNRIIWGTTKYINAEPNEPGNLLSVFGYSPVPIKFILAWPSIWTPPKKNVSIRPWAAQSKSSLAPSVKLLFLLECSIVTLILLLRSFASSLAN